MDQDHNNGGLIIREYESGLPSPEDLTPLSQSLITPQLASAFNITTTTPSPPLLLHLSLPTTCSTKCPNEPLPLTLFSDSPALEEEANSGTKDDGTSETGSTGQQHHRGGVKRPRLVWTPQLHKRFVDVIEHLGIEKAVPKTIMEMMNVDGLTRENVASHLQKYRLYLKRAEGGTSSNFQGQGKNGKHLVIGGGEMQHGAGISRGNLMHIPMFGPNGGGVSGGSYGYGGVGINVGGSVMGGYCGLESGAYCWNRQRG
ncbi:hypothetical protein Droror1_Dr00020305 [Drosera rotundifolia]